MITTGSKFLIGSTVLAIVAAIAYGVSQDDIVGTVGLLTAATALAFLTGVDLYTRDANVWAEEISSLESASSATRAPGNSIWPFIFAIGAAVVTVGLVTQQTFVTVGLVILLAAGAEWTAQAWSERASADASYNAEVRSRIANPLEFPLGAAVGVAVLVYTFSRIMLWLSTTNTVIAFSTLGTIIILAAFFFAYRPGIRSKAAMGLIAIGVLGLVAGGVAAGLDGQREIHAHETTPGLQDEGADICTSPEEFDADHSASQKVAASASVAATITLDKSGQLSYEVGGPVENPDVITLQRSNPSNIIFTNQSGEHRRLSVDLGTTIVGAQDGDEAPRLVCTALVDHGGQQNFTLTIGPPSAAATDGFFFFVPGVESARLELVVP